MIRTAFRGMARMVGMGLRGKGLVGFSEGRKGEQKVGGANDGGREKEEQWDLDQQEEEERRERRKEMAQRLTMMTFAGVSGFILYQYLYGNDQSKVQPSKEAAEAPPAQPALKLGGDWSLIDTDSKVFSSSQLSGQYYLIYFGFTKCPDICPTTLHYLSTVQKYVRSFPQAHDLPLKIVFVSVDPERDEPTVLKQYLSNFNADIIGVTGKSRNDENLKDCMKKFKIYANRVDTSSGYNMDHTTMVYLLDGSSRYIDHINPSLPQKETALHLIAKIRHHMSQHELPQSQLQ